MPHLRNVDVGGTHVTKEDCLQFKRQYVEKHRLNPNDFHMTFGIAFGEYTVREDNQTVNRPVVNTAGNGI